MNLFTFRKREVYVSQAKPEDAKKLAILHKASFARYWDSASLASMLSQNGMRAVMAFYAGTGIDRPIGFVLYRIVADEAEIITIATDPAHRQRGVGRSLMNHVIMEIHAERVAKLFLEVSESNTGAITLYKKLGFRQIGLRESYYEATNDTPNMDPKSTAVDANAPMIKANALVMELELG